GGRGGGGQLAGTMALEGKWIISLLGPAVLKCYEAHVRLERNLASLRCAEGIRLYAATHEGKLPKTLADVTDTPLPFDPRTGKGFDDYYKNSGERAVLEVPPPPGLPANLGKRFEFARGRLVLVGLIANPSYRKTLRAPVALAHPRRRPPMHRSAVLVGLLAVPLLAAAAAPQFDPDARAKTIAPFLDERAVIVGHVDLTRVDADALVARLAESAK